MSLFIDLTFRFPNREAFSKQFSGSFFRTGKLLQNTFLQNNFCKPKDKVLDKEKSGVVYQISCRDRDAVYIGETGRSLETTKRENIDAAKNFDLKKSVLCQHVAENDHFIDWDNTKILRREPHWHKRRIAEG